MTDFLKKGVSLPAVGAPSVKKAGSYICKLVQDSVQYVTDRMDVGNNPNLKSKEELNLLPPWCDETHQILFKWADVTTGEVVYDRAQLVAFRHYTKGEKITKEEKAYYEAFFMEEVGSVPEKYVSYPARKGDEDMYLCGVFADKSIRRCPSQENIMKSHRRLNSILLNLGYKHEDGASWADLIDGLKTSTELKEVQVNLTEKEYSGEVRRSESILFKITYGQQKAKVTAPEAMEVDV